MSISGIDGSKAEIAALNTTIANLREEVRILRANAARGGQLGINSEEIQALIERESAWRQQVVELSAHLTEEKRRSEELEAQLMRLGGSSPARPLSPQVDSSPMHGGSPSIDNPNQFGETISGPSDPQWYEMRCIQFGLSKALLVADADARSKHTSDSKALRESTSFYFHLHNDEATMTSAEPSNLPAVREHNSDPALTKQFGFMHRRVMSSDANAGSVYLSESHDSALRVSSPHQRTVSGQLESSRDFRPDEVRLTIYGAEALQKVSAGVGPTASVIKDHIMKGVWRKSSSVGKSEADFFFFGNFVVKSLKESEFKFVRDKYSGAYLKHIRSRPESLLPRIYATFSVTFLRKDITTRYVLMNNVLASRVPLRSLYDLKGSTVGRDGQSDGDVTNNAGARLLKDNDVPQGSLIRCGPKRKEMIATLKSDADFLSSLNVVDYSLLVGIRARTVEWNGESSLEVKCQVGVISSPIQSGEAAIEETYYVGIIDVFQTYSPSKRLENFAKGLLMDKHQISVVPPDEYADRFVRMVDRTMA